MNIAIPTLGRGEVLVIDSALGARAAGAVLDDVKRKLVAGALVGDNVSAVLAPAIYSALPGLWDSYRLISWLHPDARFPALAHAMRALGRLCDSLGLAETRLQQPLSPAWSPSGFDADPQGFLLALNGFNGTRYAQHTDVAGRPRRKLSVIYYPRVDPPWAPGDGGELVVLEGSGRERRVEPRADRVVLFHSELTHEVLPCRIARVSLTKWALGNGERRAPPPKRLDLAQLCTSDMCQREVATQRARATVGAAWPP